MSTKIIIDLDYRFKTLSGEDRPGLTAAQALAEFLHQSATKDSHQAAKFVALAVGLYRSPVVELGLMDFRQIREMLDGSAMGAFMKHDLVKSFDDAKEAFDKNEKDSDKV